MLHPLTLYSPLVAERNGSITPTQGTSVVYRRFSRANVALREDPNVSGPFQEPPAAVHVASMSTAPEKARFKITEHFTGWLDSAVDP